MTLRRLLSALRRRPAPLDVFLLDYLPDGQAVEQAPLSRTARSVLHLCSLLTISAIVWAAASEVDQVASAPAKLISTAPPVVVQPLETAVIRSIDVAVGQQVRAGQRLASLDPTFAAADLADLSARLNAAQALEQRLRAEQDDAPFVAAAGPQAAQALILERRRAEYAARLAGFDERVARLTATQETARANREGLKRRLELVEEIERIRERSHRNQTGSLLQLLEARSEKLRLSDQLTELTHQERGAGHELRQSQAERSAFIDEWRRKTSEELVTVERERATLTEQSAKARRRAALAELNAPVDSVVLEIAHRSLGSVAREAEALFTLIPTDAPLEAEADISSADIGLTRVGDPVRLKLEAFPFQQYGVIDARLRTISADAFPREAAQGGGVTFRARAELLTTAPANAPSGVRLSPGMTGTAEIIVGRRTVLSYFLYPVIRLLDESIREP
jgi:hemolysin D